MTYFIKKLFKRRIEFNTRPQAWKMCLTASSKTNPEFFFIAARNTLQIHSLRNQSLKHIVSDPQLTSINRISLDIILDREYLIVLDDSGFIFLFSVIANADDCSLVKYKVFQTGQSAWYYYIYMFTLINYKKGSINPSMWISSGFH